MYVQKCPGKYSSINLTSNVHRLDSLDPRLYKAETSLFDSRINRSNLSAASISE